MSLPIALVSARAAQDLDEDLPPLLAALRQRDLAATVVDWDDPAVDWRRFGLAVLRSTWDYTGRLEEFRAWLRRAGGATTVLNPPALVDWNVDKHYLAVLEQRGVASVPSAFIEPGEDAAAALDRFLARQLQAEMVVKPVVGAGSRDAQRYGREQRPAMIAHAQRLLEARRGVMLQPYLARVDEIGETALVYFDGQYSHAFRKGPLLKRDAEPTRALFATEHITPRQAADDELALGARALAAIPGGTPLYARVDLIRADEGAPCVLELELAEPSLYFAHAPGAAERMAAAIARRCGNPSGVDRP